LLSPPTSQYDPCKLMNKGWIISQYENLTTAM